MKIIYLILFVLMVLFFMPSSSGYTYADLGNEPGMKFWNPQGLFRAHGKSRAIVMDEPSGPLKWLPVVSVCLGTVALCFQVFVLYPWHLQLSSEFANLQISCLKP